LKFDGFDKLSRFGFGFLQHEGHAFFQGIRVELTVGFVDGEKMRALKKVSI